MFFGGNFSHAIKKVLSKGDFRAHSLFGAQNISVQPSTKQIDAAAASLKHVPQSADYIRVDGIYSKGRLLLIELEFIEPHLYFEYVPSSTPAAFGQALIGGE